MLTMRAVSVKGGKGGPDNLFIEDGVPDPEVQGDRVLLRIHAYGLNRMDIMQREGKYPYPLLPESGKILGVEFSGVVQALGPDCTSCLPSNLCRPREDEEEGRRRRPGIFSSRDVT